MKLVVKQITKFFIIGVSAVLVDFVIYYLLSDLMGQNLDLSKGMGFLVGTVYKYYLNKLWTWKYTERSNKGMLVKFGMVYAVSFVFNILINKYGLKLIPEFDINLTVVTFKGTLADAVKPIFSVKGHKFLAFFFATVVSAVINFLGQKFLVFRTANLDPKDDTNIEVS